MSFSKHGLLGEWHSHGLLSTSEVLIQLLWFYCSSMTLWNGLAFGFWTYLMTVIPQARHVD